MYFLSTWNKVIHLFIHSQTTNLSVEILLQRKTCITNLSKEYFVELFIITIVKSLVLVDGKHYQKTDGVTKITLIGTSLVERFSYHQLTYLKKLFPYTLNL